MLISTCSGAAGFKQRSMSAEQGTTWGHCADQWPPLQPLEMFEKGPWATFWFW